MTQLTISDKLRNLNHDMRVSDLQSESDLDSIRNSCDVLVRNKFSWMSSHFSKDGCNISNLISSLVHFCHYTRRTKTILWNFTLCCFEKLKKRKSGRDVPFKIVHSYLKRLVHSAPPLLSLFHASAHGKKLFHHFHWCCAFSRIHKFYGKKRVASIVSIAIIPARHSTYVLFFDWMLWALRLSE